MPIEFTNNATSLLAAPVLAADTTLTIEVADVGAFPVPDLATGDYFYATLEDRRVVPTRREIVKVTDVNSATYTVVRAQDNTAAYDFFTGAIFSHRLNAAALFAFRKEEADARTAAINVETAAREAADTALQNQITAEANARIAGDANLQTQLNNEITRAEGAETGLQTQINNLNNTGATKDALNAEIARAEAAEANLQNALNVETAARIDADTNLTNYTTAAVNDLVATDQNLQAEIDALKGATSAAPSVQAGLATTNQSTAQVRVTFAHPWPTGTAVAATVTWTGASPGGGFAVEVGADATGLLIYCPPTETWDGTGFPPGGAKEFNWIATPVTQPETNG